jgi:alkylhydroperoxidase/carboxymuconolactone decarboxylase family protein YurZ
MSPPHRADFDGWLAAAAAGDRAVFDQSGGSAATNIEESGLDVRTHALVRLAALVTASDPVAAYDQYVDVALDHGVTPPEIVGVLVALIPAVGAARVTVAARAVLDVLDRTRGDLLASRLDR